MSLISTGTGGGVSDINKDTGPQYTTNDIAWDDWGDPAQQTRDELADPDNPLFGDPDIQNRNPDPVNINNPAPPPDRSSSSQVSRDKDPVHQSGPDRTDSKWNNETWYANQTSNGVKGCATEGYVDIGDLIIVYGPPANPSNMESNISGVKVEHVNSITGYDGGELAIYVAHERGSAYADTSQVADFIHTGEPSATGVNHVDVGHSPQEGSTGKFFSGMTPGDIFIEWDEDSHGGEKQHWGFTGRSSAVMRSDCGVVSREIREVTAAGDLSRRKEEWVEETGIKLSLSYIHKPFNLTATAEAGPRNEVEWGYTFIAPQYIIEQPNIGFGPKFVKPIGGNVNVERFYSYGDPDGASMNPTSDMTESEASKLFFYTYGSRVSLVIVHDKANDGDGGEVNFAFSGMPSNTQWAVGDDGGEAPNWKWYSCCTDGGVFRGGLDTPFSMNLTPDFISGISDWYFLDTVYDNKIALDMNETLNLRCANVSREADSSRQPDKFVLERRKRFADNQYGDWYEVASVGGGDRSYTDRGVSSDLDYEYRVRAVDNQGNRSDPSNKDEASPSLAQGFVV